jgi:hypothetical protein
MSHENDSGNDYDLFMSYSHADSKAIVESLVVELEALGLDIWYDSVEMGIGDSIRESIDEGLRTSSHGVVVLSESYFEGTSEWELNGLVNKHTEEGNVILPLWHGVGYEEVYEQSASLADLRAETVTTENIQTVATDIYQAVPQGDEDTTEWGTDSEDESSDGPSFMSIEIRFQDRFDPEIGKEVTIESWRNHSAPNFSQLEATEIRDEDRGIDYTSSSKGTMMTVKRIDDEPLNGVISDIGEIRSGKTTFTIRVRESRIDDLSDDPDDYKSGLVR